MSENNEFYSDILILHKDGLYSVNGKQFKSLENAKTYIDTFLNLSDSPKISNSPKISESLTINDVINSIELKNYFGNKSEKWIPELTKLFEKKKLGDLEVNDKNLQKLANVLWRVYWRRQPSKKKRVMVIKPPVTVRAPLCFIPIREGVHRVFPG